VSVAEGSQRELEIINAVAEELNRSPDVGRALQRTLALVAELLGLHTGWVWLLDRETNQFYSAAVQDLPPYLQEPVRMAGGRSCWCIEEFRDGQLQPRNIDVMECSRLRPAVLRRKRELTGGLGYHASVPLYFQDQALGIMNLTGPEWRELTPQELRLLSTIANQVGIAIERARLADEATRLARTEERARLAREIHDTLAQGLTAIALNVEGALRQLDRRPDRARERLEVALATARENLEEARRSVLDLRAAPLAGKPLAEALAALGRSFTSQTGVRVRVRVEPDAAPGSHATNAQALGRVAPLPLRVEAELYRIAQEALTNVRKHARASEVEITLARRPGRVTLTLSDNGRGFDVRARPAGHHGIVGMRERAHLLGGRLRISSRRDHGTRLSVWAPVEESQDGSSGVGSPTGRGSGPLALEAGPAA
jgi:two-component system, NarL family, sensor kinase